MTVGSAGAAGPPDTEATHPERIVASRVVDTLLRERYGGLSWRLRCHDGSAVLDLPGGNGGRARTLPLERDGFLADFRLPRTAAGLPATALTLDDVDAAIAALSDPRDRDGVAAFAGECRQALAALRLRERHRPAALGRLARAWQAAPATRSGWRGLPGYEALAAGLPHPAYPTSESRSGFSDEDALRYAPEYGPEFALCWVAVPRFRLTSAGELAPRPAGWPTMPEVGIPAALAATHDLLPVHPVTARGRLALALAEAGLSWPAGGPERAVVAPGTGLLVTPTLSTRTVAMVSQPDTHLKLPLPTSTLGLRNRRSIAQGTLADGALVRGIVATACHDDPLRLGSLLLADESSYAHAGHPFLGYLLRRLPSGLDRHRIVPVAALLAPSPDGVPGEAAPGRPLVIEELARWAWGGDLAGLLTAYLRLLFGVQVRLFARYGIALESHQQNAAIALEPPAVRAGHEPAGTGGAGSGDGGAVSETERLRLLVKDFDGALVHLPRLKAALGRGAPGERDFADSRLVTASDDALADVFITITVHLCAGALAFGLARSGVAPLPDLLALVRRELTAALDREAGWPATSLLRARVLDADRLPGKSMVTAGTLVAKSRTGASDINKFYGTDGPNYLKDARMRSCR
ncbi:MAG TPA: IucA/IucC family protein [Actinospica sp.]|nr:IucA/IucC family protein [Actinospica sp.]